MLRLILDIVMAMTKENYGRNIVAFRYNEFQEKKIYSLAVFVIAGFCVSDTNGPKEKSWFHTVNN